MSLLPEAKTKMKKTTLVAISLIALVMVIGSWLVEAAPPLPASFYGTVKVNGAKAPAYVVVTARIAGVTYASASVEAVGSDVVYSIDVPGDTDASGIQGGVAGDTIQFYVSGILCSQTATWQEGVQSQLNLTASGTLPTSTPTTTTQPTKTSTRTPTRTNTPLVSPTPVVVEVNPGKDAFISDWEKNTNYGGDHRLKVRSSAYRSLVYFDTSFVPDNATVTSAELHMYLDWYEHQTQLSPNVSVHKVLTSWEEMQATWNNRLTQQAWGLAGCNASTDREAAARSSAMVSAVSSWYTWDVTELVQEWVWNAAGNNGLILISDSGRELRFHSSEFTSQIPYLRIEYTTGGGSGPTRTATPTSSGTPVVVETLAYEEIRNASKDSYIDTSAPTKNYENQGLRVTGIGYKRSLLDFDVSAIPSDAEIVSATLRLTTSTYDDGNSDRAIDVGAYLVKRNWVANQVTWNLATSSISWGTPGADDVSTDRGSTASDVVTVQDISSGVISWQRITYDWDVTSIVQAWIDDPDGTAGLMLLSQSAAYRDIGFWDSAFQGDAGSDLHPVVYIYWRTGHTEPTPEVTPSPTGDVGTASVSGTVYADLNASGTRDAGELGVLGVTVRLVRNGSVFAQGITPGDGSYTMSDVSAGPYELWVMLPDGYGSRTSVPLPITLNSGENRTIDLGIFEADFIRLPLVHKSK